MNTENCWYKDTCPVQNCNNCARYKIIENALCLSGMPEYLWVSKELFCYEEDEEAFNRLNSYRISMDKFVEERRNLYIYSKVCGNGKTTWATKLILGYLDKVWHKIGFRCKVLFISVPKFLYDCKRNISQTVEGFEELCNIIEKADLVVWDDIAVSNLSGYEHQIMIQYIDNRLNCGQSNIFTGNKTRDECESILGNRLTSRIFGSSEIIELVEEDKRGA